MRGQNIQHFFTIVHATAGWNDVAEYNFLAFIVQLVVVEKAASFARLENGPAGEAARHLRYILLRITAVHAERVQLHQLAAVVFIQAALHFPVFVVGIQVRPD